MLLKLSTILILSNAFHQNSAARPNYITDEEFQKVLGIPLIPSNTSFLPLPKLGENIIPQPKPGFGPKLWTNGQVPYTLDPNFTDEQRQQIAFAFNVYHESTCILFIPRKPQHSSWVEILHDPTLCGSAQYCMNNGAQFAKFGGNCVNAGTIIHELGHTLCMGHEQTRLDRDKWIGFNTGVCTPPPIDGYEFQSGLNKLYDYVSVEHGEEECHNGCFQPRVPLVTHCGSGGPLSVLDIEVLNEMYGCNSGCQGYRYVNMNNPLINPVAAGTDMNNGDTLYSCRAYHEGDIVPGKYDRARRECYVGWQHGEHTKREDVEILTNPNGANFLWVRSGSLPSSAVKGGRSNKRENLYVIRCLISSGDRSVWTPGKYQPSAGAYTTFGGSEVKCNDEVEYLTCV